MRRWWPSSMSLVCCLAAGGPVFAQIAPAEASADKNYVMCYFLVGLSVALGLIVICRSSRRRKEVRRPEG